MADQKQTVVTIINKNYPPNAGITGQSANELATFLVKEKGFRVKVVHTNADYGGTGTGVQPVGELIQVRGIYNGKNKLIRLFASFIESYLLISTARRQGEGLFIVMTDPPFLVFWSAIMLKKNRWAYWSMDLYPDAFRASQLVSEKNLFYRQFKKIVQNNPPDLLLTLGEMQKNYLLKFYGQDIPSVMLPCGIVALPTSEGNGSAPAWYQDDGRIYLGYCGNLGEAHSKDFILEVMEAIDSRRHVMILSVYGSHAAEVLAIAERNPAVIIQKNVSRPHLKWIDVHLVTLLPHWNHICVPSKAFSAVSTGGTILFCGSIDNDNWFYLNKAGWLIDENLDKKSQIRNFLSGLSREGLEKKRGNAITLSFEMNHEKSNTFERIADFSSN